MINYLIKSIFKDKPSTVLNGEHLVSVRQCPHVYIVICDKKLITFQNFINLSKFYQNVITIK
jgi:hypothetical protein